MRERYHGLDVLRGLGVFMVIVLHSAFYRFGGLYDLDMDDPPAIVTVIGLLLMFAGLFAMISGAAHGTRTLAHRAAGAPAGKLALRLLAYAGLTLVVAYAYFLFTGPGIVHFETRSMDESLFVALIGGAGFRGWSADRLLYVDSLVMLGMNLLVMAAVAPTALRPGAPRTRFLGVLWAALLALSIVRIPLFDMYMNAREAGNLPVILALNWVAGKNNPLLPYAAFGVAGLWLSTLLATRDRKGLARAVLPPAAVLLAGGVAAYVLLPDTMLERAIDAKWYAIMCAQMGLFLFMVLFALARWDLGSKPREPGPIVRFLARFGTAGLTPFFLESVVSVAVWRLARLVAPTLELGIGGALAYGFALALAWGFGLMAWEKAGYRYGIEWLLARTVGRLAPTDRLGAAR